MYSDIEYLLDVFLFGISIGVTSVSSCMNNQTAQTNQDKQSNTNNNFIHTHLLINIYIYSSKVENVTVLQTESVTRILKSTTVQPKIFLLQIIKNNYMLI